MASSWSIRSTKSTPINRSTDQQIDIRFQPTGPEADAYLKATITNNGKQPLAIAEVTLYERDHNLPPNSQFYGEGFTMLSQTGGTLGKMVDMGVNHSRFAKGSAAVVGSAPLAARFQART